MTRLGAVGGSAVWHTRAFAGILNPKNEAAWAAAGLPPYATNPVENASVVAICDDDHAAAQQIADLAEGITLVTDNPRDLLDTVDGVLICDDMSQQHQKRASLFLEAGVPTFIDKPLSRDPQEAEAILSLAERHGTPVMSCSALRYSTEYAALDKESLGDIVTVIAVGPNELVFYGIHPCEFLHTVMGPGVKSVRNFGDAERNHVLLDYGDGRMGVMVVREDIAYTFRATLLGTEGSVHLTIDDGAGFYREMLRQFIGMVRTGQMPVPPSSTLEIIRILDAAVQSREMGKEVVL